MHLVDTPDQHATITRIQAVHQRLVIRANQETMAETTAETITQLFFVAQTKQHDLTLDNQHKRTPILIYHIGNVLKTLHAALDLEATHTRFDELRKQIVNGQILGAQKIFELLVSASSSYLAIHHQIIRHATALGAL